jgi:hypothetical protein
MIQHFLCFLGVKNPTFEKGIIQENKAFIHFICLVHSKMIEFWLRYNWHWLSAAIIFSAAVLGTAIQTGFECKWAYDTVIWRRRRVK